MVDVCHTDVLGELATACERLNRFAESLRSEKRFVAVTTGNDLRVYQGQWMFEKFVEATLNRETGKTAVWWLDVSKSVNGWHLHANTSISYGDYDEDVGTVDIPLDNLRRELEGGVSALIATYGEHAEFRREIERLLCSDPGQS